MVGLSKLKTKIRINQIKQRRRNVKLKLAIIAASLFALPVSSALAEEGCTTEAAIRIKDDLTSKGYEVHDVTCRLFDVKEFTHRYEVDVKKDTKEMELWLDEKFTVLKEHVE